MAAGAQRPTLGSMKTTLALTLALAAFANVGPAFADRPSCREAKTAVHVVIDHLAEAMDRHAHMRNCTPARRQRTRLDVRVGSLHWRFWVWYDRDRDYWLKARLRT